MKNFTQNPKTMKQFCTKLFSFLVLFLLLVGSKANAQFNTGTISINGSTTGESAYVNNSSNTAYSMAWDNTYLYLFYNGGASTEPVVAYFDYNPTVPVAGSGIASTANGNPVGYNNTNSITPTLPFLADFMIYWTGSYAEWRRTGTNGAWSGNTVFASGEFSNSGSTAREIRIPWSTITNGGSIPSTFNWTAFAANSGTGIYNSIPTLNTGGSTFVATTSPLLNYYYSLSFLW